MNHRSRTSLSILCIPLASALLMAASGCSSDPAPAQPPAWSTGSGNNPPDEPSDDPETYFTEEVYPSLSATCGQCHQQGGIAPPFLGSSADTAYAAVKANANLYQPSVDSLLLKKGEHQGPALVPAQIAVVTHWLDLELPPSADDPNAPPPVSATDKLLEDFASCMSLGDWQQSGMSEYPLTQTLDSGDCAGCHFDGLGGTFLNIDVQTTFEANKQQPYILKLVEVDYSSGQPQLVQSRRLLDKGDGDCPTIDIDDFDICHPKFDFGFSGVMESRLNQFVGATLAKARNGGCGGT